MQGLVLMLAPELSIGIRSGCQRCGAGDSMRARCYAPDLAILDESIRYTVRACWVCAQGDPVSYFSMTRRSELIASGHT